MPDYPKRGHGKRYLKCELYGACLDIASAERWEDFHCEGCPEFQKFKKGEVMEQAPTGGKESVRLCEQCKEKPTISPGGRLCASCMAKRSHKKKAAKEEPGKVPPKQPPKTGAELVVTVHFGEYGKILEQIEYLAKEETRTPELQILHMLKQSLNPPQKGVDTR